MLRRAQVNYCVLLALLLSGCGTVAPQFTEFWNTDPGATSQKVVNVAAQISCELQKSVVQLIDQDKQIAKKYHTSRKAAWLENWGVLVTLTLNVIEKTDFTPGINFNNLLPNATPIIGAQKLTYPQSFTFGLNGEASTTATRSGIVHMFYTVEDLLRSPPAGTTCVPSNPSGGFVFVESELGIKEWMFAAVAPDFVGLAAFPASKDKGPLGQDAISQEFKFQVVSSAGINPSWKLIGISANTGPVLLNGSRDRYQDLLITLGPLDKTLSGRTVLGPSAQALHQAQQFGIFTSFANQP